MLHLDITFNQRLTQLDTILIHIQVLYHLNHKFILLWLKKNPNRTLYLTAQQTNQQAISMITGHSNRGHWSQRTNPLICTNPLIHSFYISNPFISNRVSNWRWPKQLMAQMMTHLSNSQHIFGLFFIFQARFKTRTLNYTFHNNPVMLNIDSMFDQVVLLSGLTVLLTYFSWVYSSRAITVSVNILNEQLT